MQHKIVTGLILSNKTNKTIKNDLYNNNIIENINDISTKYPPRQILGFKILNLPEFTEETLDYNKINQTDIQILKDLNLYQFYNMPQAFMVQVKIDYEYNDNYCNPIIVLYDNKNQMSITLPNLSFVLMENESHELLYTASYFDNNQRPLYCGLDKISKTKPKQPVIALSLQEHLCKNKLYPSYKDYYSYWFMPGVGPFITSNRIQVVLWSKTNTDKYFKNNMFELNSKDIIDVLIRLDFNIDKYFKDIIIKTPEYIGINDNIIIKDDRTNKSFNTKLIIPDGYKNVITEQFYNYNDIYFPETVQNIYNELRPSWIDLLNNTRFYFKKNTLKLKNIEYMIKPFIKMYYKQYNKQCLKSYIPDKFDDAVYLKDALDALAQFNIKPINYKFI